MNKKVVLPFLALGVLAFGTLISQNYALAAENVNPETTIVEKIATKFDLNKNEVQKVFDEQKIEMQAQMQAKNEERLTILVSEGKITEAQRTLILNKHKELHESRQSDRDALKELTPEEKKAKMEAKRTELNTWAKENGIDPDFLFLGRGMREGHGPRMGM